MALVNYENLYKINFCIFAMMNRLNIFGRVCRTPVLLAFYKTILSFCDLLQRVMPSSFFILLRYFLRIDNLMLRMNDNRYYHEFDRDCFLRVYTSREAKAQDLNVRKQRPNLI